MLRHQRSVLVAPILLELRAREIGLAAQDKDQTNHLHLLDSTAGSQRLSHASDLARTSAIVPAPDPAAAEPQFRRAFRPGGEGGETMIVIKVGGGKDIDVDAVCDDLAAMRQAGREVLLVHGGAETTNDVATALGHPPQFLESESGTPAGAPTAARSRSSRWSTAASSTRCGSRSSRAGHPGGGALGSRRPHLRRWPQGHAARADGDAAPGAARRLDRHRRSGQHRPAAAPARRRLPPGARRRRAPPSAARRSRSMAIAPRPRSPLRSRPRRW